MVTHNWGNKFCHLIAAILSEAIGRVGGLSAPLGGFKVLVQDSVIDGIQGLEFIRI